MFSTQVNPLVSLRNGYFLGYRFTLTLPCLVLYLFEGIHIGHIEGLIGHRLQYLGPLIAVQ